MGLMNLLFGKMIDRRIAAYQNDLITKHCDEVQNIYKTMRGWRHDFHNHIQTLIALSNNAEKTKEYRTLSCFPSAWDKMLQQARIMMKHM